MNMFNTDTINNKNVNEETLEEMSQRVNNNIKNGDVKRYALVFGGFAVVVTVLAVMYSSLFGTVQNAISQPTVEALPTKVFQSDLNVDGYRLRTIETINDIVYFADESNDVWMVASGDEVKFSNATLTNYVCDSNVTSLSDCGTKQYSNDVHNRRYVPELASDGSTMCANGQRLWVDIKGGVMTYRCAD